MQIAILVYPGFTALDAIGPYEVFNVVPDLEVRFVWKEVGPVVTDSGVLVVGATHTLEQTPTPDVVLVPGSTAETLTTASDPTVTGWLRAVHAQTEATVSVCSGSVVLASAGLLDGMQATSHWAAMPLLTSLGAVARPEERVVRQGKVFTAAGVSAGIDLALTLVELWRGTEEAEVAQLLIEYDPQPPREAGHMGKASASVRRRARSRMVRAAANPRDLASVPTVLLQRFRRRLKGS